MSRRPAPLPRGVPAAFRVSDAVAHGIPRGRLYHSDLDRPHHGARMLPLSHTHADAADETVWEQQRSAHVRLMQGYIPVLAPDGYFCGPSAALLWRIPLPPRPWTDLHVGVPRPRRAPRRPGVTGYQHTHGFVRVIEFAGMPVVDAVSTWATLATLVQDDDLVAVADHLLRIPRMPGGFRPVTEKALAAREQLAALAECKGRPGAPRLRRALELARTGASSPPETRIRLLIRDGGLPEPMLDYDVYDDYGLFLGCSELAYPDLKVAIEYESDGHLRQTQLRRDIDKYQLYAEAGWMTVRLTSEHVYRSPAEGIRRIRHAFHSRG